MPDLADAVIVGGGILGTALACELARRTLRVVLLEAQALGSGATGSSFAWINATAKADEETYHRLNAQAVMHYASLALEWEADKIGLRRGGCLFWTGEAGGEGRDQLRRRAARLQAWGYPVAILTPGEMRTLEPQIRFGSGETEGLFAPADRWIDTSRLLRTLTERAREGNADIRPHCPATGFTRDIAGFVSTVETPQGRIATRQLILASGVQTPEMVRRITGDPDDANRFPLRRVPGLLVETAPGSAPGVIHRILFPPDAGGLHLRPTPGGGLLIGADDMDNALTEDGRRKPVLSPSTEVPLSAVERRSGSAAEGTEDRQEHLAPDTRYPIPDDLVSTLLERTARLLPELSVAALKARMTARICVRPVPADGLPIIGQLPGVKSVWVAVTHSGVTLGPLLAHLLADEITTGRVSPLLTPYRPYRFLRGTSKTWVWPVSTEP
jgi:glycine/D-amino acid oxidase-like deaminating enzyme